MQTLVAERVENSPVTGILPLLIQAEFFLTGVLTALLGPVLPGLRAAFGISEAQAGSLFVAQFLGSSLGAVFSQWRCGFSIILGLALMGAGVAALPFTSFLVAHFAVFIFGLGLGFAIPATNMLVAHASGEKRAAALNILNMTWGAGAASAPLLVGGLQHQLGLRGTLVTFAIIIATVFTSLLFFTLPNRLPGPSAGDSTRCISGRAFGYLRVFCLALFLYVGVETSVGGWTSAYVGDMSHSRLFPTLALSCFWLALLVGRALAPGVLRLLAETKLHRLSLITAAAGLVLMFVSRNGAEATLSAVVIGAGLAPVFALNIAQMSRQAETHRVRTPGWLFSVAGMGGAALPWLSGQIGGMLGSLRYAFLVPTVGIALLLVLLNGSKAYSDF